MQYVISDISDAAIRPYGSESICQQAGVSPNKLYDNFDEACADAEKLNKIDSIDVMVSPYVQDGAIRGAKIWEVGARRG